MRISIPGLGGRLRRARNETRLSQEAAAERIGVSWMTVHRWERSQRAVPEHLLDKVCEVYRKSLCWFLTLEDGDLDEKEPVVGVAVTNGSGSDAAERVCRMIADAPAAHRPMIEQVVEDMLDGLMRAAASVK